MRAVKRTFAYAIAIPSILGLAACQSVPVDRPCGVITDSLKDVRGATPEGDKRISIHFERGRAAGCWR